MALKKESVLYEAFWMGISPLFSSEYVAVQSADVRCGLDFLRKCVSIRCYSDSKKASSESLKYFVTKLKVDTLSDLVSEMNYSDSMTSFFIRSHLLEMEQCKLVSIPSLISSVSNLNSVNRKTAYCFLLEGFWRISKEKLWDELKKRQWLLELMNHCLVSLRSPTSDDLLSDLNELCSIYLCIFATAVCSWSATFPLPLPLLNSIVKGEQQPLNSDFDDYVLAHILFRLPFAMQYLFLSDDVWFSLLKKTIEWMMDLLKQSDLEKNISRTVIVYIMDPSAIASLQVTNTEVKENNKRYTVYKVFVNSNGKSWFIFRRYNEFHNLYEEIKELYPSVPKFPGKRIFGNLDPKFIERRRCGLDQFVRHLLSNSEIIELKSVREFFGLSHMHGSTTSSDSSDAESESACKEQGKNDSDSETENHEDHFKLGPSERKQYKDGSSVYLARHKDEGNVYAVKVLSKSHIKRRNEVRHIMSERNVLLTNVKHPFLVGLHYSFQTKDKLYFVLDYLNGGELFFHLQREKTFSESRARFYAAEIGSALGYLHEKNIIYRDLKPENLLLDSKGHVVLTDFGLCKEGVTGKQTTSTFCGTPEYLAPEVLLKQPYDRTVDWWCLGSVLYEMLFGLPPFYSRDHKEMYERILYQPLRIRNIVSQATRDVLIAMLQKDRFRRLGARHDFKELRDHQFFLEIDWKELEARNLDPPFNPQVRGVMDFRNIDSEFTREAIPDSVGKSLAVSVQGADNDFAGFTYVPKTLQDIGEDD